MRAPLPPPGSVLLLIDLQKAIDHPGWGQRNNPAAEQTIGRLLEQWRARGWPVWHVRHDSVEPQSTYRPGQAGNDFKPECAPLPGEPVMAKRTNSAFIGTDLEQRLRAGAHEAKRAPMLRAIPGGDPASPSARTPRSTAALHGADDGYVKRATTSEALWGAPGRALARRSSKTSMLRASG